MRKQSIIMPLMASLLLSACATNDLGDSRRMSNTEKGAIIGSVSGAALGAIINHKNRGKGALIGAVGGGLAGTVQGFAGRSKKIPLLAHSGYTQLSKLRKPFRFLKR